MTMMVSKVFDALIEAGASQESARKAAAALTERSSDLVALRDELAANTNRLATLDGKVTVLLAVNGLMFAAALAGLGKVLLAH